MKREYLRYPLLVLWAPGITKVLQYYRYHDNLAIIINRYNYDNANIE